MSKSKGRRLAEWLRNLDSNSRASSNTLADDSVGSDQLAHNLALQGNPTAATQSSGNSSTRLATTAFVATEVAALVDSAPGALNTLNELAAAVNDDASFSTTITNSIALKAPLASPALTGTPTAPTASSGTNTTQLATTAFVTAATSGLATDTNLANKAPINSPTFTGTPAAPTASAGTNTTQIATTAFVTTAVASASTSGISSSADATAITISSNEKVTIDPAGSSQSTHELSVREADSPRISIDDINGSDTNVNAALLFRADTTNKGMIGYIGQDDLYVENKTAGGSVILGTNDTDRLTIDSSGNALLNGKLSITDTQYDNHLELNRSSEQWRISPSTDGSLDIRRVGGTGTAVLDVHDDLNVLGSLTTEGPDGGGVIRQWPGSSVYTMFGTANMGTSEYSVLCDGTNTFIAGGSGGSTFIRSGANDTVPQIIVKPSSIDLESGVVLQTYADTTGNSSSNAFTIDYNLSGNDTLTADRSKTGLFVDLDSSSTGGDTSNEHRLYGIRSDVRATGDSDLMYGIYGYAESQHSAGTVSQVVGVYGLGVADETTSGRTSNTYGLLGVGYGYGSGSGDTGTLYGCYARGHATAAQDKNLSAIYGGYFEAELDDPGQAQTCTNAYGLRSLMDDDSGGNVTGTAAYGLYVNFSGTWNFTNKYAIYAAGNHVSYFGGEVRAAGDVTAYYSDERLKIKQGKIENALEKVNSIETFYFTNNELAKSFGYTSDKLQVGVSAQSVEKVMPEVIKVAPFDADSQGNSVSGEDYKTVQYDKLVPLLIESIKELKAEIEELKKGR